MGPDWLWVGMFVIGGVAMGLITSLVGLGKGREIWYWLGLFGLMLVAVLVLNVEHPFWTMLVGGVAAGLVAGSLQSALMPWYRRHNAWFAPEMARPARKVALGFILFTVTLGTLFGVVLGGIAWGLSGLFS